MNGLAVAALIFAATPCALILFNLFLYRPPRPAIRPEDPLPAVSVLIPARNEANNIGACLQSVLNNRQAEIEAIVLDDHSEDETAVTVRALAAQDPRVRLETAPALPAGWVGKAHACHVLGGLATQPILVFIDADVRLRPDALVRMAGFLRDSRAAFASGIPQQETQTWGEILLIPLIHFVLLGFLPMIGMRLFRHPAWGAGVGQLVVTKAEAYRQAGGHTTIPDSLHDGLRLARSFRKAGLRTDLFDATDVASCRMYASTAETFSGLAKNAIEGMAAPKAIGIFTVLLLGGQVLPWLLLACSPSPLVLAGVALSLLPRLLLARVFKQAWIGALLHPVGIVLLLGIQWYALAQHLRGRPRHWRGRSYA